MCARMSAEMRWCPCVPCLLTPYSMQAFRAPDHAGHGRRSNWTRCRRALSDSGRPWCKDSACAAAYIAQLVSGMQSSSPYATGPQVASHTHEGKVNNIVLDGCKKTAVVFQVLARHVLTLHIGLDRQVRYLRFNIIYHIFKLVLRGSIALWLNC